MSVFWKHIYYSCVSVSNDHNCLTIILKFGTTIIFCNKKKGSLDSLQPISLYSLTSLVPPTSAGLNGVLLDYLPGYGLFYDLRISPTLTRLVGRLSPSILTSSNYNYLPNTLLYKINTRVYFFRSVIARSTHCSRQVGHEKLVPSVEHAKK